MPALPSSIINGRASRTEATHSPVAVGRTIVHSTFTVKVTSARLVIYRATSTPSLGNLHIDPSEMILLSEGLMPRPAMARIADAT